MELDWDGMIADGVIEGFLIVARSLPWWVWPLMLLGLAPAFVGTRRRRR